MIVTQLDFVVELLCKREALAAHLATVEDFVREETKSLEILEELALALALDELAELDELANELDALEDEEAHDESV